jgi:hypothetical protein
MGKDTFFGSIEVLTESRAEAVALLRASTQSPSSARGRV